MEHCIWLDYPTLLPRFGIVTKNVSESVNCTMFVKARDRSWLSSMYATILSKMIVRIDELREKQYKDKKTGVLVDTMLVIESCA